MLTWIRYTNIHSTIQLSSGRAKKTRWTAMSSESVILEIKKLKALLRIFDINVTDGRSLKMILTGQFSYPSRFSFPVNTSKINWNASVDD